MGVKCDHLAILAVEGMKTNTYLNARKRGVHPHSFILLNKSFKNLSLTLYTRSDQMQPGKVKQNHMLKQINAQDPIVKR